MAGQVRNAGAAGCKDLDFSALSHALLLRIPPRSRCWLEKAHPLLRPSGYLSTPSGSFSDEFMTTSTQRFRAHAIAARNRSRGGRRETEAGDPDYDPLPPAYPLLIPVGPFSKSLLAPRSGSTDRDCGTDGSQDSPLEGDGFEP